MHMRCQSLLNTTATKNLEPKRHRHNMEHTTYKVNTLIECHRACRCETTTTDPATASESSRCRAAIPGWIAASASQSEHSPTGCYRRQWDRRSERRCQSTTRPHRSVPSTFTLHGACFLRRPLSCSRSRRGSGDILATTMARWSYQQDHATSSRSQQSHGLLLLQERPRGPS